MSELLTVAQVARILKVSEDTALPRFEKVDGVIDLGSAETSKRRRYRVLRIPKAVVEKFLLHRGGPVRIEEPVFENPTKRRRKEAQDWQDQAAQELALAAKENGGKLSRKTMEKIAKGRSRFDIRTGIGME